jgi:hypothetical protein
MLPLTAGTRYDDGTISQDNSLVQICGGFAPPPGVTRLTGKVFTDSNGNHLLDAGEAGTPGATVTVVGSPSNATPVNQSAQTAGDGSFTFTNLPPGDYTVSVTGPSGTMGASETVSVSPNQSATATPLPVVPQSTISGSVADTGSQPVPGVTETLSGTTNDGQSVSSTAVSSSTGAFSFSVPPGTYTVTTAAPPGYTTVGSPASSVTVSDGSSGSVSFVLQPPLPLQPYGTVTGTVYTDNNGNGVRDAGEPGDANVVVTLTSPSGTQTATTDASGAFVVNNVPPDTYTVSIPLQSDMVAGSQTVVVSAGQTSTTTVGYEPLSTAGGTVTTPSSQPVSGATLTLNGVTNTNQPVSQTATTTNAGTFMFTPVPPGNYVVTITAAPGDAVLGAGSVSSTVSSGQPLQLAFTVQPAAPPPPPPLVRGDTATIGYWQNKNGQALIKALNGGPTATNLGNWLASHFPYLYGPQSPNNLTNATNSQVAALFLTFFNQKSGPKASAQVLGGALDVYVTTASLAGNLGGSYGFNVGPGTGMKSVNVGSNGVLIGLSNNTSYTVMALLQQANLQQQLNAFNANAFNDVFSAINQLGDIQ